jgi:hypothetical protein
MRRSMWLEINASPERLDPKHLLNMRYGLTMARRA